MDWFLYDRDLHHEIVKLLFAISTACSTVLAQLTETVEKQLERSLGIRISRSSLDTFHKELLQKSVNCWYNTQGSRLKQGKCKAYEKGKSKISKLSH